MVEAAPNNSAMVSSLVSQLKQGNISKGELFARLAKINRERVQNRSETPKEKENDIVQPQSGTSSGIVPDNPALNQEQPKPIVPPRDEAEDRPSTENNEDTQYFSTIQASPASQAPEASVAPAVHEDAWGEQAAEAPTEERVHTSQQVRDSDPLDSTTGSLGATAGASSAVSVEGQSHTSTTGMDGARRRALIQRLLEEKKKALLAEQQQQQQQQQQALYPPPAPHPWDSGPAPPGYYPPAEGGPDPYLAQPPGPPPGHEPRPRSASAGPRGRRGSGSAASAAAAAAGSSAAAAAAAPGSAGRGTRRSASAGPARPRLLERQWADPAKTPGEAALLEQYGYYAHHPREGAAAADDPAGGHSSTYNRALRSQEAIRQQLLAQCTFKPQVKELPSFYGAKAGGGKGESGGAPFPARVARWQREQAEQARAQRQAQRARELADCTFAPNINQNSLLAAAMIQEARGLQDYSTAERLYLEGEKHLEGVRSRLGALKETMDDQERQHCTFRPDLSLTRSSSVGRATQSRYREGPGSVAEKSRENSRSLAAAEMARELTFHPRTKGPGRHMAAAHEYLSQNVFERLAAAAEPGPEEDEEGAPPEGEAGSAATAGGGAAGGPGYSSFLAGMAGRAGGSSARGSLGSQGSALPGGDAAAREKAFHQFLHRQDQMQLRRKTKAEELQIRLQPDFRPALTKKSLEMMDGQSKGTFLQRVERDQLRKEHAKSKLVGREVAADADCTFAPAINPQSARRPGRSAVDMSRGDLLRRATQARLTKLRTEQRVLSEATFRPWTNNTYLDVPSRLKVASDLGSYLSRVQEKQHLEVKRRKDALTQKESEEDKEMTFKPKIKECPGYIKKMAEGIAKSKAMQGNKTPANTKPDWR